jgi:vitamin-K-epoxide reductase (warfarin-sensitive)
MGKAAINGVALAGIVVACYALYIETSSAEAAAAGVSLAGTFACDNIVSWASCSAALTGPYGHVLRQWGLVARDSPLDVPNALIGLAFYVLALTPWAGTPAGRAAALAASAASLAFSAYLAYVLRFVIHEFCIVCVTSYTLNAILFGLVWSTYRAGGGARGGHSKAA